MLPVLSVLVAIILGLYYPEAVREPHAPDLAAVLLSTIALGLAAHLLSVLAVRRARASGRPTAVIQAGLVNRTAAVGAYAVVVYSFHWPAVTGPGWLDIEGWLLVDELVVLLPFAVMLALSHMTSWWAESRLELHQFRLGGYLAFHLRQYLLPTVPVLAFLLFVDLMGLGSRMGIRWVAELRILYGSYPFVQWITLALLLFLLYCLVPFLMRWIWRAHPLPPGPLRDRLLRFSRREGFRARDILVWPTGGNVLNAAVIGVAGPFRYVLVTDALLEDLGPDEIEAVFAHEVGHARHRHILLYFLFSLGYALLAFLLAFLFAEDLVASLGPDPALTIALIGIGGFLLWFGLLFGFVSRRFEQQADVFGALSTGRAWKEQDGDPADHPFVRALEKLSRQMGDIRESKGWRHFSLSARIDFLVSFLSNPRVRRRYRSGMALLLLLFFGLLGSIGLAAAFTIPKQVEEGRLLASQRRLRWFAEQDRPYEARFEILKARRLARAAGEADPLVTIFRGLDDRERVILGEYLAISDPGLRATRLIEFYMPRRELLPPLVAYGVQFDLALALEATGRRATARGVLFEALRGAEDDPVLLDLLALSFARDGLIREARLAWEIALSRAPPGLEELRRRMERGIAVLPRYKE